MSVLEVGAGVGLTGLVAHALGARVLLTDGEARLVEALRTRGGQRRFLRADIRRVSFILIAQQLGLALEEIGAELARLPAGRTPNAADWARISTGLGARIDAQIAALQRTRELLGNCIGCGCLSLKRCALYNPEDRARTYGAGPRYIIGDKPLKN